MSETGRRACTEAGWLTAEEVCADAATADYAWGVGGSWDNSTQTEARVASTNSGSLTPDPNETRKEG